MIAAIIFGIIALLLGIAVIRTFLIKAPAPGAKDAQFPQELLDGYAQSMGDMIRIPTVSKAEDEDLQEYIGKPNKPAKPVIAALRPELLHDEPVYMEKFKDSILKADVEFTELMGAEIYLYLNFGNDEENEPINMISRVSSRSVAKSGDRVEIAIDTNHIHFFDKETEKIIIH